MTKYAVEFVLAITNEVANLIAAKEHISVSAAKDLFMNSKVYDYLCNPPESFYEEDPQYFFEMYMNLKNNPQLYSLKVD